MALPDPINQFNRLIYVSGPRGTGTYNRGSRWNNMHNGANFDSKNCTPSMGAVAIDAHTGGRIKSYPGQIRAAAGDWTGGMNLIGINAAWAKLWPGNQLILPSNANWADTIAFLRERRFVIIQGDNDQMGAWSCQAGGDFAHAYALAAPPRASDGRVLLYDPLCNKARWIPQSPIRLAAEKLAMAERGTKSRLFVGLTRPMLADAVHWGVDVSDDIQAAYTASAVASKLRSLGITNYGSAINLSDMEAGLEKRGINYGTSVQLVDVRALMKPGTGA